ncbi:MAG: outer membrane protein assembly factor BamD [Gemmatimonadales bacterium]
MKRGIAAVVVLAGVAAACGRQRVNPTPSPQSAAASVDSLWRELETAFYHGRWGPAQRWLDSLFPRIPGNDPRYYRLHFMQGEVHFAQGNQLQAVREFRRVADEQPEGPLAADALVRAGDANADLWRRPELDPTYGDAARTIYEEVLARYPGSPAAKRAALRLTELAEKFAMKDYKNAVFYFRYKAYDSAILMLRSVIATYPRAAVVPDALERLVRAYQILGYQEDVKETCAYIRQYHPQPGGPVRLCPEPGPGSAPGGEREG